MNLRGLTTYRRLLAPLCFLIILNLLFLRTGPKPYKFKEGDIAPSDIIAPYTFPIPKDSLELKREEEEAALSTPLVFRFNPFLRDSLHKEITSLPQSSKFTLLPPKTQEILKSKDGKKVLEALATVMDTLLSRGVSKSKPVPKGKITLRRDGKEIDTILPHPLTIKQAEREIKREAERLFPRRGRLKRTLLELSSIFLKPNLLYDETETERRRAEARERVPKTKGYVLAGELIVEAHKRVDKEALLKLSGLRSVGKTSKFKAIFIPNLFYITLLSLFGLYLFLRKRDIWQEERKFYLLFTITSLVFLLGRVLYPLSFWLIPIGLGSVLLALFLDIETGIFFSLFSSLIFTLLLGSLFSLFIPLLFCGIGASLSIYWIRSRKNFYYSFGFMLIAGALGIFLTNPSGWRDLLIGFGWMTGGSFISAMGALLIFPFLERIFSITTDISLLDLIDLNHPLFQRMALLAPGTYQHSIAVGGLAEAGARAIGADPILARAGGYYHDIGKLYKPRYFIENQTGRANPHDRLSPQESVKAILAHTTEAVKLAKKYRLPREITDIILQHHGTTRVEAFYRKAKRRGEVREEDYRYPGPKPQTKEAALVMLADTVEAVVRAKGSKNPEDLRRVIREAIEEKFRDGQLDESPITRRDLSRIEKAFFHMILGIVHPRVDYK